MTAPSPGTQGPPDPAVTEVLVCFDASSYTAEVPRWDLVVRAPSLVALRRLVANEVARATGLSSTEISNLAWVYQRATPGPVERTPTLGTHTQAMADRTFAELRERRGR